MPGAAVPPDATRPTGGRLLFLSPVFPMPLDRGQHVRVLNLVQGCSAALDVTFVGPPPPSEEARAAVERLCERAIYIDDVVAEPLPGWSDALPELLRRRIPVGRQTLRFLRPYAAVLDRLPLEKFDLIWAERLALSHLCRGHARRTIVDLDDIEHTKTWTRMRARRHLRQAAADAWPFASYWLREVVGMRGFLACVVCSDEDRRYLRRWGLRNVVTVRNGVDLPDARPPPAPDEGRQDAPGRRPFRLVFLGNMAYGPNRDAVEFLAGEVLPLVAARLPAVEVDVIGAGVDEELKRRFAGRLRFRGFVEDLPAVLARYDVFVAPLRVGGGTKVKVLDAMASRVPIVTTPVGAMGLGLEHGVSALIGESAQAIADHIVALHDDRALAARMADRAFETARRTFLWAGIREDLAKFVRHKRQEVAAVP